MTYDFQIETRISFYIHNKAQKLNIITSDIIRPPTQGSPVDSFSGLSLHSHAAALQCTNCRREKAPVVILLVSDVLQ